ncbi:hypothetical protein RND71_000909 [Anisodus tanguticus]|uniref:Glabrous enhancer-binding protein-like DBD domain-containing protein n=1 Tax=Anisodus tanguticus TaxID=243964 RepID=A0AAE1SZU0_9SOLA|nr:hypothetical protein RND71_000909 [Anisodus tanguticus]
MTFLPMAHHQHQQPAYHDDDVDVDGDDDSSVAGVSVSTSDSPAPSLHQPDRKRPRIDDFAVPVILPGMKKPSAAFDESRKLFQRLWTDEDEVELLQGFLDYTTQRGLNSSSQQHHYDTTAFYDQIKCKFQLDFNKNQLVEKLRRLKKKYRTVMNKMGSGKDFVFKSAHDQTTFEISRKIWSSGGSYVRNSPGGSVGFSAPPEDVHTESVKVEFQPSGGSTNVPMPTTNSAPIPVTPVAGVAAPATTPAAVATSVPSLIEETVRNCVSPIFKELLNSVANLNGPTRGLGFGFGGMGMSPIPLGFGGGEISMEMMGDEKWRKQQMLELEVYSKRLELIQDQVKAQLEELRSTGS